MSKVVVDTNWLVALVDGRDKWHTRAREIAGVLAAQQAQLVYLDCVLNETISVLARRAEEQKRLEELAGLLEKTRRQVPEASIVWASLETRRLYGEIMEWVQRTRGALNFHDALIALLCREWGIKTVVSFDEDFDQIVWLTRISRVVSSRVNDSPIRGEIQSL